MSTVDREKQIAEAEELIGDSTAETGLARALYFGRFQNHSMPTYPIFHSDSEGGRMLAELKEFAAEHIDPVDIDRQSRIPDEVVAGLGRLGILGACLPVTSGGRGLDQVDYCRFIEVLGGHCGGTALFVNAHHSIGPRSLVLFGTQEQQDQYLPKLATGEHLSAFALTEPEAGSDASNVQTQATPTADGSGYVLNGEKRWITNGGIAKMLTVMARTPGVDGGDSKITAFIVTPDMPGFEVLEERMDKCGVRGSATGRLAFHDMFVPKENILGPLGGGLKLALTVLDFGRTTFGASCTGAAKFCVKRAAEHAARRVQFGEPLGNFELVKDKLAYMSAGAFAMEACTYQTAAMIDSGGDDYMVETAMLKVFATDTLWRIVNDTLQIYGGKGYFTDEPYERMMRDARINMIGEGANDVLRAFVALVGMRDVGLELKSVLDAITHPLAEASFSKIGGFAIRRVGSVLVPPLVDVKSLELEDDAQQLGRLIGTFGNHVERLLRTHREAVLDRQYLLARVSDTATELYVSACVLSRLDSILGGQSNGSSPKNDLIAGRYYLKTAARRMRQNLAALWDNDDPDTTTAADAVLAEHAS